MKTITYYAAAMTEDRKIGQLFVTRENGRQISQEWTGVVYDTAREADNDLARLNS